MKRILLGFLLATLSVTLSYSQCMLSPVSLQSRTKNAVAIVEGEVMASKSYWNNSHTGIYTLHQIRPTKVFSWDMNGAVPPAFYMVTEGGTVGNTMQHVTASLELEKGDVGVFFCQTTQITIEDESIEPFWYMFEAFAGPQGCIKFDNSKQLATDPFATYTINPDLYTQITQLTGKTYTVVGDYKQPYPSINVAPIITSFSPDSLSAGTKSVLTITGTGFGSSQGSGRVRFKDANSGGSALYDPEDVEYVSWTDTEIKVEVTSRAGTGKFTVDNGSGTVQSATNLVITFSQLNVVDGNNKVYQPIHIGENGTGYTWQFYTDFDANSAAKQSFLRAFQNWRCGTLINWDIGTTTTVNTIARDNVNVIRFDVGSELPNGVLGRCSSWWSGCSQGGTFKWYVAELDIVFDDGINWNFGPGNPAFSQYDFESVAVHELGHGHQLGHVIKSTEIMHYSIANGQKKRDLSNEGDLSGGNYVMDLNLKGGVCAKNVMVALNPSFCSLIPVAGFSASATSICPLNTVTFTDTSGGSTNSFTWDFGVGALPATAVGKGPHNVTYASAGLKTVQLIVGGVIGNDTSTKVDLVEVMPDKPTKPVAIFGADTACVGSQQYQIAKVANALTYEWGVVGGTVNKTTDTLAFASFATKAASASIWVKATNSCGSSDSVVKQVPVLDKPSVDFSFAIQNDTIFLTNTTTDALSYLWKLGNGQTATFQNLNVIPAQSGNYVVKLLATNFCGTDSTEKTINFIKSSIGEVVNKIGALIYPNPFTATSTIKVQDIYAYNNLIFEMYDITGRKVQTIALFDTETTIAKGSLATGMYVYKIQSNGELLAAGRLVIE